MWSRLTVSVFIDRKRPSDVIDNIMLHWVRAGGEFSSDKMREICSISNVQINTTAGNSPFQNGLCERILAVTDTMLLKLREQCPKAPIEVLLSWANVSRNSRQMWHCFSSYQLVFGRNPNLPNVMSDKAPAFTGPTTSETLEKHLNALYVARKSFIETESNEWIRRALRLKVRSCETVFSHGDSVFYKREEQERRLGSAKVVFQDKVIFLRHGGMFIRSSPNQLLKTSDNARNTFQPTTGEEFDHPDTVKLPNQSTITSNQLTVTSPCAHKIISSPNPTDLPDNPLPPPNHIHTNELPNNQLGDDRSDESSNNQLTHNQQPDVTANHTSKVDNNESNKLETMANKLPLKGDRICYKNTDSQWINAVILGRAGKSTGKYKHWYNVRNNDFSESSVNLDAVHWKVLPPNTTEFANATNITENQYDNDFINAKYDEIEKLKHLNAYEDSRQTCISTTWVFNCKGDKVRARLVARGYEESTDTRTDSPTIMKSSFRTFLTIISSKQWAIKTTDIKSAFLQGAAILRYIFIKLPAESTTLFGMIWKLRRCLYGLNDAARQFYESVHTTPLKLGCSQSNIDPALCIYRNF